MAATNLQVANRAIREVGGQPIDDLSDARSSTSRIVNDALPFSIEEVLSAFDWTINQVTEAATGTANPLHAASAFTKRYDLTSAGDLTNTVDRVIAVYDSAGAQIYEYHIEGIYLYSSEATLYIRYAYQLTDVATLPSFIVAVISAHLAKEICLPLSGDAEKKMMLEQQYTILLEKAKITSLLQNPQQAYIDDSTLRHIQKAAAVSSLSMEATQPSRQRSQ